MKKPTTISKESVSEYREFVQLRLRKRVLETIEVVLEEEDVSRGPWKKNGALHSVIRVSYQAATSACSRTSLRRW